MHTLTDAESRIEDHLIAAWNEYVTMVSRSRGSFAVEKECLLTSVPTTIDDALDDFRRSLSECQRVLAMRMLVRARLEAEPNSPLHKGFGGR
jgi:hypothetical protein